MIRPILVASALATLCAAAVAQPTGTGPRGYAVSADGQVLRSGQGECVRSGYWTPADAVEPCDPVARAPVFFATAPDPQAEPTPEPAPEPLVQPEPARPVIQKLSLSAELLFQFNQATLSEAGERKLDALLEQLKDAEIDEIVAVGHADRIASAPYNQKLSEERAQAVKRYLEEKGVAARELSAAGKGESEPVTGDACRHLGHESARNRALVACLQPDRRVDIEVLGTRELAAEQAATGASSQ